MAQTVLVFQRKCGDGYRQITGKQRKIQDRRITFDETDNWTASDLCAGCDLGLPPTFALGATLIAPRDLVKSLEVLSLAALTSGLPHPEVTSSFSESFLNRVLILPADRMPKFVFDGLSVF